MTSNIPINPAHNFRGMESGQHLVLLGCGKMGSAMLRGWLQQSEYFTRISVIEPAGISDDFEAIDFIVCYASLDAFKMA